jgi:ring-1,2-phenylacetyl-CoA epoxidase subunit PaaE
MSSHFHSIPVNKIFKETEDCVVVSLNIPNDLKPLFMFKEGQNITIKKSINGEELRRSYSICNAPHENELKVAIKKVDGGLFSTYANETLTKQDVLEIMPPSGKFNAKINAENPNYLAIAAGSGITPIISIIKHLLHVQPESQITLIYGSKNKSNIIFFEELEALKNKYMNRFSLINILSREKLEAEIFHGRITAEKLADLSKVVDFKKFSNTYLCGPEEMIFSSSKFLEAAGINQSNIHFELFSTPGQQKNREKIKPITEVASGPKSKITIKLDERTFSFDLAYNGESILDAALKNGADLPYACKGGVCCTCRAKLMTGNVSMDVNYALEAEEIEQGFVLTCQSHPTTENVFIDFDVK